MFRVTKQFAKGREAELQSFATQDLALEFVQDKIKEDVRFKLITIYRIYDDLDMLLNEINSVDHQDTGSQGSSSSSGGSGKPGSSQSFNPTPFNTSPTIGPRTWIKDKNDSENDDENESSDHGT